MQNRKKQLMMTVASNLILQFVTAICGFILPPLIVETFGSSINGMVSSITQFISYLNLVEAGIGGAAIAALYSPLSRCDYDSLNGILSATKRFYNKSGILFSVLIFSLAFVYPLFIGAQIDKGVAFFMVLVLGISGTAEFFLIGKYRVLLIADKKLYVISIVQAGSIIINTIIAVFSIKLGASIILVKFLSAMIHLSRYFVLMFYIKRNYRWLNFNRSPYIAAINQSKNVLVHQIAGLIVFNSPVLILTIFCSLKEVSVYTVYAMVFSAVSSFLNSFANGLQSFFGESLVKDSLEKSKKFFMIYRTFYIVVECWFYSMTYVLIMPFMSVYTKGMVDANYMQPTLALMFIVVGFLNNLRLPEGQLINAAGHFKKTQSRAIIELCLNLFFSITCTIQFGFIGVLFGSIVSSLYRDFDVIIYSSRNILKNRVLYSVFTIVLLVFIYCIMIWGISFIHFEYTTYLDLLKFACILALFFAIPVFFICCFFIKVRKIKK